MTRLNLRYVLLTVVGATWVSARLVAQAPWTELRGDGFSLRGQLSTGTLTAVSCDVETAARALRRPRPPQVTPRLVAVENAGGIREWLPQYNERGRGNPLGAYWRGLYGHHIVVRVDAPPPERLRRVIHEYAHFITHVTNPEPATWLDEGISEVWEHVAIGAGILEVGRPVQQHLQSLRDQKNWIPLQELVAANAIPTRAASMFYAESWALVHYLLFEKRGGQLTLDQIPNPAEIPTDSALMEYVRGPLGPAVTIPTGLGTDGCPDRITTSTIPALRALLDRAEALADGDRPDSALPLLREVLRVAPDSLEAMEVLGFVHFRGNRPQEAAAVFDRVIATGNGSHISFYYRVVLATPIPNRTGDGEPIPKVEYLRTALVLNPGFAPAVQRLRELTGKY